MPLSPPRGSYLRRRFMLGVAALLALCLMGSGLALAQAPQSAVQLTIHSEPFVICPG
jgi:hypothetical protein